MLTTVLSALPLQSPCQPMKNASGPGSALSVTCALSPAT
jgi:hypothetical protein